MIFRKAEELKHTIHQLEVKIQHLTSKIDTQEQTITRLLADLKKSHEEIKVDAIFQNVMSQEIHRLNQLQTQQQHWQSELAASQQELADQKEELTELLSMIE